MRFFQKKKKGGPAFAGTVFRAAQRKKMTDRQVPPDGLDVN